MLQNFLVLAASACAERPYFSTSFRRTTDSTSVRRAPSSYRIRKSPFALLRKRSHGTTERSIFAGNLRTATRTIQRGKNRNTVFGISFNIAPKLWTTRPFPTTLYLSARQRTSTEKYGIFIPGIKTNRYRNIPPLLHRRDTLTTILPLRPQSDCFPTTVHKTLRYSSDHSS